MPHLCREAPGVPQDLRREAKGHGYTIGDNCEVSSVTADAKLSMRENELASTRRKLISHKRKANTTCTDLWCIHVYGFLVDNMAFN